MPKYVTNPPDASALMTSARSFGKYDLAGALADLIDNSIKAKAKTVALTCDFKDRDPEIRVRDDGTGMDPKELHTAMRPASTHPSADRSPDDLGRFGWGLKSASFSQCQCLTVLSRKGTALSGAVWDLTKIDGWSMGVLSAAEAKDLCASELQNGHGTEVIWRDCDRLTEGRSLDHLQFNTLVALARKRIALIFHRFLTGEGRARKLVITLNNQPIEASDPFYRRHPATQPLPEDILKHGRSKITVRPFILPHFSKLNSTEQQRIGGAEGLLKNQGFYVYRNHRLILSGTWFRLVRHGELSQIVRIGIDIPNSLDSEWKLTLDKSDAQLPAWLQARLRTVVQKVRGKASDVYRGKGGRVKHGGATAVWERYARHGEVRYRINRAHPLIQAMKSSDETGRTKAITASLMAIEQGFPVDAFGADVTETPKAVIQTFPDVDKLHELVKCAVPPLLHQESDNMKVVIEKLKGMEPFHTHWTAVESFLKDKGWMDA